MLRNALRQVCYALLALVLLLVLAAALVSLACLVTWSMNNYPQAFAYTPAAALAGFMWYVLYQSIRSLAEKR